MDKVFKALADETRRSLLDRLREQNGQTLGELCERIDMARQSVTQHLAVLEAANLISTVRRGREKLHYLNPVPLHEMQERWIDKFERPRLRALGAVKRRAEEAMTDKPTFVYVTYIASTPEKVWEALTSAELTADYWGHRNESDWRRGSRWAHVRVDGSGVEDVVGTVVESEPPTRLVTTWAAPEDEGKEETYSRVTFDIERHADIVRLTVTHEDLADESALSEVSFGWPAVLSNLKSLLETGRVLPQEPWEVPRKG
ncbi:MULTISPECIES: ArsR/SmtB family transcription factor [Streptomyces]|uniref:Metalloregulator ArsR/SmtB family transcription factor n=1 Tax=Streptomyces griseiscabiei TaxID=2993540 RepID=A0ABU4L2W6_9ACTN|nr:MULTISPECIES: metalloregulator ArsR/SmtB family transcription factor [Streptomyces]MBZ3901408.1 metalloregulator ArsR/SmtB family transcription factor [Streptomyces griseiscabiei]MDX2910041.1 metalloregulator ArsR/SmtB family transcription factor [Streptomyces griseiscabiei]